MKSKINSLMCWFEFIANRKKMMESLRGSGMGKNMNVVIIANLFNANNSRMTMNAVKSAMRKEYWGGK